VLQMTNNLRDTDVELEALPSAASHRGERWGCPPCTGNCYQGRACPARDVTGLAVVHHARDRAMHRRVETSAVRGLLRKVLSGSV